MGGFEATGSFAGEKLGTLQQSPQNHRSRAKGKNKGISWADTDPKADQEQQIEPETEIDRAQTHGHTQQEDSERTGWSAGGGKDVNKELLRVDIQLTAKLSDSIVIKVT